MKRTIKYSAETYRFVWEERLKICSISYIIISRFCYDGCVVDLLLRLYSAG